MSSSPKPKMLRNANVEPPVSQPIASGGFVPYLPPQRGETMSVKLNVQFSNWTEKGTRDELQNKRKIGLSRLTPIFFRNKRKRRSRTVLVSRPPAEPNPKPKGEREYHNFLCQLLSNFIADYTLMSFFQDLLLKYLNSNTIETFPEGTNAHDLDNKNWDYVLTFEV